MTEVGFYHLLSMPLERALPKLIERVWTQGHRILVRAGSPERVEHLDVLLWTYEEASFLPHGSEREGNAVAQPIWLTHDAKNPNGGSILLLIDCAAAEHLAALARCADL